MPFEQVLNVELFVTRFDVASELRLLRGSRVAEGDTDIEILVAGHAVIVVLLAFTLHAILQQDFFLSLSLIRPLNSLRMSLELYFLRLKDLINKFLFILF